MIVILRQGQTLLIERLDRLKSEVREITLTVTNGELTLPTLPGQLISHHHRDRQWRLLLRATDESHFAALREAGEIADFECRTPSLEDIFVGYLKGSQTDTDQKRIQRGPVESNQQKGDDEYTPQNIRRLP